MVRFTKLIILLALVFVDCVVATAQGDTELLPPDQAFKFSSDGVIDDAIKLSWVIADGYYLYRDKFKFSTTTQDLSLAEPVIPAGKTKHDDYFGDVEILRGKISIRIPFQRLGRAHGQIPLSIVYQGCADIGVCYPPEKKKVTVRLPSLSAVPATEPLSLKGDKPGSVGGVGLNLFRDELLPADEAFRFIADVKDGNTVHVAWQIADGYYLYRQKFGFSLLDGAGVQLGKPDIPPGKPAHDEAFGDVEIFYDGVEFDLPLLRSNPSPMRVALQVNYQGCAERGVCYPPIQKSVVLELPQGLLNEQPDSVKVKPMSEQSLIAQGLKHDALWLTVISFFGFGLILAFTPCVLPMIPILSGLIIGQGENINTRRAFLLSSSYVLAAALTYTVFGILAGLFGSNLQVLFQSPWIIVTFSLVFVLLALSMFDFYTLQMPAAIQSKLSALENRQAGGTLIGAFIMGVLSALIVGPCVAAPLIGVLIYIGQSGDAVLGGLALFSMGLGMGFPLLIIGASAGKLLPKAGPWMNATKAVFGVLLLAVAVWFLERILPAAVTMLLWSALLIIPAIYLHALDPLPSGASGWQRLWKGCAIIMLVYGVILVVGVASGGKDPLQPLTQLAGRGGVEGTQGLTFEPVESISELDGYLDRASQNGQWVMLDYYADWCISCKEMERYTFSDKRVQLALHDVVLLRADVTENNRKHKKLLARFGLIGPPATLFFGPDKQERKAYRVVGYKDADNFVLHLMKIIPADNSLTL